MLFGKRYRELARKVDALERHLMGGQSSPERFARFSDLNEIEGKVAHAIAALRGHEKTDHGQDKLAEHVASLSVMLLGVREALDRAKDAAAVLAGELPIEAFLHADQPKQRGRSQTRKPSLRNKGSRKKT